MPGMLVDFGMVSLGFLQQLKTASLIYFYLPKEMEKKKKLSFVSGPLHRLFSAPCSSPLFVWPTAASSPSHLSLVATSSRKSFLIPHTPSHPHPMLPGSVLILLGH